MSAVAEQDIDLTDEQIEELLKIPEIRTAFDHYHDTKSEYRSELLYRLRESPPGELPNVSDLNAKMRAELMRQEDEFRRIVMRYVQ